MEESCVMISFVEINNFGTLKIKQVFSFTQISYSLLENLVVISKGFSFYPLNLHHFKLLSCSSCPLRDVTKMFPIELLEIKFQHLELLSQLVLRCSFLNLPSILPPFAFYQLQKCLMFGPHIVKLKWLPNE